MPDYRIQVGNVELVSVSDGFPQRSPLIPFPDTTMEQWREFPELLDEHDQVRSRYGTVAVRSSGKLIIVDTGLQAEGGTLLDDMEKKGIDREAVDLVVFTHLHPDHVGWNLTNGRPNFPNARYLVPRKDWDYWTQPNVAAGAEHITNQVIPLQGLNIMDLIDDGYNITDELTHSAYARPHPRPRFHHHRVRRRAGLHPGRRGSQRGPSPLHRLVSHLRHRAGRVPADPPFGAGYAGSRGHHCGGGTLPRPGIWSLRPRRKPPGVAGSLKELSPFWEATGAMPRSPLP